MRIRDATAQDAGFLAWAMFAAQRSHLSLGPVEHILGLPESGTLAFYTALAATDDVHWCHHSLFSVAEVDGTPAAALCGFDPRAHGMPAFEPQFIATCQALGIPVDAGLAARAAAIGTCNPDYAQGAWVVENVATRAEFRRRGLVDALLAHQLARGRSRGFTRGQIAVLIGNEPARAAYLKAGFEPAGEKRHPDYEKALGCPGMEVLLQPL